MVTVHMYSCQLCPAACVRRAPAGSGLVPGPDLPTNELYMTLVLCVAVTCRYCSSEIWIDGSPMCLREMKVNCQGQAKITTAEVTWRRQKMRTVDRPDQHRWGHVHWPLGDVKKCEQWIDQIMSYNPPSWNEWTTHWRWPIYLLSSAVRPSHVSHTRRSCDT